MDVKLIGEVAKEFGLRPGTLRYYETLHLVPTPKRSAGGYRLYDGESRQRLGFIANAKSLGLTLREIRQIITARSAGRLPCGSVRIMLADHVRQIDQQVARLRALKFDLRAILSSSRTRSHGGTDNQHSVCLMIETMPRLRRRLTKGGRVQC